MRDAAELGNSDVGLAKDCKRADIAMLSFSTG
jgi:hypothetical protein